jgi:HK97 family phage prohead protease
LIERKQMKKSYSPARVRSASFNERANTIEVIWSTGSDVLRYDDYGNEIIERLLMGADNVRLDRLNAGAPLLDTHSSDNLGNVIGSVVPGSARLEGSKGLAVIKLSSAAGDADTVQKIREGVIRNISVGYIIHRSVRADGEDGGPDIVEVRDWEPLEISAVPIPADPGAQIRSAGRMRPRDRQSPAQRAAAYARSLLNQSRQTSAEARGAAEARALLGGKGSSAARVDRAKSSALSKAEIDRGAREARKLLRRS